MFSFSLPFTTLLYRAAGISYVSGYLTGAFFGILSKRNVANNVSRYGNFFALRFSFVGMVLCCVVQGMREKRMLSASNVK